MVEGGTEASGGKGGTEGGKGGTEAGSGKGGAAEPSWRPGQCAGWCRAEATGEAAADECALLGC